MRNNRWLVFNIETMTPRFVRTFLRNGLFSIRFVFFFVLRPSWLWGIAFLLSIRKYDTAIKDGIIIRIRSTLSSIFHVIGSSAILASSPRAVNGTKRPYIPKAVVALLQHTLTVMRWFKIPKPFFIRIYGFTRCELDKCRFRFEATRSPRRRFSRCLKGK